MSTPWFRGAAGVHGLAEPAGPSEQMLPGLSDAWSLAFPLLVLELEVRAGGMFARHNCAQEPGVFHMRPKFCVIREQNMVTIILQQCS